MKTSLLGIACCLAAALAEGETPAWKIEGLLPQFREEVKETAEFALPAGIEAEPEPDAKVVYVQGMPKISLNGKIIDAVFNQSDVSTRFRLNAAAKASSLGITINQLAFASNLFETGPGEYDFSAFDRRIRKFLAAVPDAKIMLLLRITLPKWTAAHPEAQIAYANGPTVERGDELYARVVRPSIASPAFRAEMNRFVTMLGEYIRAQPWGRRVVAVRPAWGIYTEWHTYGMYQGPDVGLAMTEAFRRWKGGKYANENPPTMEERVSDDIYYLDRAKHEKVIDFYECMANEVADGLLEVAHTVKTVLPGRLVGMYYGYVVTDHPPEGANAMLDKVLASPDVDFLSNPADYINEGRRAGGAYYHRTIPATYHRYGKLAMLEDDMRHHHVYDDVELKGMCTRSPRESAMVTRRNWLNCYFDGCGIQNLDPEYRNMQRMYSMDTFPVWHAVDETRRLLDGLERPADSGNDTAVVVDWRGRFRCTPKEAWPLSLLYKYSIRGISASSVPVDLMTLDDFLAQPEGRYRKAVFLNAFASDPEMQAALEKRVSAPDFRSVWLVRCPFALPEANSRVVAEAPEQNDFASWREILTGVGAHAVAPAGHYVRRHGDYLMFHTGQTGRWELDIPGCASAEELFTGRCYPGGRFTVETDGPDTMFFRLTKTADR